MPEMISDRELAQFIAGALSLKQTREWRVRNFDTREKQWLFATARAWKELGVFRPDNDQMMVRRVHTMPVEPDDPDRRSMFEDGDDEFAIEVELVRLRRMLA